MNFQFKAVIFFSVKDKLSLALHDHFASQTTLKTFKTSTEDEVLQIADMAERSAVILDNYKEWADVHRLLSEQAKSPFKIYLPDWHKFLMRDRSKLLTENGINVLSGPTPQGMKEKIELYLFGKLRLSGKQVALTFEPDKKNIHAVLFTHFMKEGNSWRAVISTHENVPNIHVALGLNWNFYLEDTMADLLNRSKFVIKETTTPGKKYHQLIYPHFHEEELVKLSIMHIDIKTDFTQNLNKCYEFLKGI